MTAVGTTRALVRVQVPAGPPGRACWARALSAVDPAKRGGYGLEGAHLERGAVYDLPAGMLIVTAEKLTKPPHRSVTVTLWRAEHDAEGGLALVKSWTNKTGRIGPQILKGIGSRLAKSRAPRSRSQYLAVRPAAPRPNQWSGICHKCGQRVPAGQGLAQRHAGRIRIEHHRCPPRRNLHPDECLTCGGWVQAREGVLMDVSGLHLQEYYDTPRGQRLRQGRYRVVHDGGCPDAPAPRPQPAEPQGPRLNRRPGPCQVCWRYIPAGGGHLLGTAEDLRLVHPGQCPPNPLNPADEPTWTIHERDGLGNGSQIAYDYPAGTIARVVLADGPAAGPGWRELTGGEVSVIGVVVAASYDRCQDEFGRWADQVTTVWRVATDAEAAPILDGEAARFERAGLTGRARALLALNPGAAPADAHAPSEEELRDVRLVHLPAVPFPAGAGRRETCIRLDEDAQVVWTVVHNAADGDDWRASNWGGHIAYRHPLTPERRRLLEELRAHTEGDDHGQ